MTRVLKYSVAVLLGALALFCLFACGEKKQLKTPCNLQMTDEVLTWNAVENAQGYHVDINGMVYETDTNSLDTFYILDKPDTYQIAVEAFGNRGYESEWSDELSYTIQPLEADFYFRTISAGCYLVKVNPENVKGKVIVPAEVDGNAVLRIDGKAFKDCTQITGILIPEGVEDIGPSAFSGCTNLERVSFPSTVTKIAGTYLIESKPIDAGRLFQGCDSLTSVTVHPDNPTYYSEGNCIILRSNAELVIGCAGSEIPNSVTAIGENAFYDCSGLKSIVIPDSVTAIREYTFYGCSDLKSIVIPDSVTAIREYSFCGCSGLKSIIIPDNVTTIERRAFYGCSSLESFTISDNVTTIERRAFYGCSSLESVFIGASVKVLWGDSFGKCHKLSNLTVSPNNPYFKSEGNCIIRKADNTLVAGCTYSEIPEGIEHIGQYAFFGSGFSQIRLPQSLRSIGECAFADCSELKRIYFPQGLQSIGSYAFLETKLTTVILPEGTVLCSDSLVRESSFYSSTYITAFTSAHFEGDRAIGVFYECQFEGEGENQYLTSFTYTTLSYRHSCPGSERERRLPYRKGYTFVGWAIEEGGEVVYAATRVEDEVWLFNQVIKQSFNCCLTDAQEETLSDGTVLYAVWQKNA